MDSARMWPSSAGGKKKIVFMGGLPRSGSTLLCNILAQNPRFHTTGTSGFINVYTAIRQTFWLPNNTAFRSMPEQTLDLKVKNTMRGAFYGYYEDVDRPVVVEKSRGVENQIELLEHILDESIKIICPVRDIRDILASFEKLWRETAKTRSHPDELAFPVETKNIYGRCDLLMRPGSVVGGPRQSIIDAIQRGYKRCLHFVEYEELCKRPRDVMRDLYHFLHEDSFDHDFENVKQVTIEDDLVHVYKNLHKIKAKVEPQQIKPHLLMLPRDLCASLEPMAKFWKKIEEPENA